MRQQHVELGRRAAAVWLAGAGLLATTTGAPLVGAASPPPGTAAAPGSVSVGSVRVSITPGSGARVVDAAQGIAADLSVLQGVVGRAPALSGTQRGALVSSLRGAQSAAGRLAGTAGPLAGASSRVDLIAELQANGLGIALSGVPGTPRAQSIARRVDTVILELLGVRAL